jgi:cyclophilin family peptidyl-prolyl cis-trans isomerase
MPRAFLDVAVGAAPPARVTLALDADAAPRAVANFMGLCGGGGRPARFRGTTFHRIIPG